MAHISRRKRRYRRKHWFSQPHTPWLFIFWALFVLQIGGAIAGTLIITAEKYANISNLWLIPIWSLVALFLAYFIYTLCYLIPRSHHKWKGFLREHKNVKLFLGNYAYRTTIFMFIMFIINIISVIVVLILGIFRSIENFKSGMWWLTLGLFFLILSCVRAKMIYDQFKKRRKRNPMQIYRNIGIFLLILIVPNVLLVWLTYSGWLQPFANGENSRWPEWINFVFAYVCLVYNAFRLIFSIVGLVACNRQYNFAIKGIARFNFAIGFGGILNLSVCFCLAYDKTLLDWPCPLNLSIGIANVIVLLVYGIFMIATAKTHGKWYFRKNHWSKKAW